LAARRSPGAQHARAHAHTQGEEAPFITLSLSLSLSLFLSLSLSVSLPLSLFLSLSLSLALSLSHATRAHRCAHTHACSHLQKAPGHRCQELGVRAWAAEQPHTVRGDGPNKIIEELRDAPSTVKMPMDSWCTACSGCALKHTYATPARHAAARNVTLKHSLPLQARVTSGYIARRSTQAKQACRHAGMQACRQAGTPACLP
jgi:hypothetical protein